MPGRRILTLCFISALLAAGLTASCRQQEQQQEDKARAVETVRPETADLTRELSFPGQVSGVNSSSLSFEVAGVVDSIAVEEGDRVEQGDLLASLGADEVAAQADSARANWQVAQTRLQTMQKGERPEEIARLESRLASAKESHRVAEAEHRRIKNLYQEGVVSESRLDQAEAELQRAETELESARQALNIARQGARQEDIQEQRQRIDAARANYRALSARLENHRLRAPFDGVVAKNSLDLGERVAPSFTAIELVETERLKVEFEASVQDARLIEVGDEATIRTREGTVPAEVVHKPPAAAPSTGLVPIEVRARETGLTPGESVEVRFSPVLRENVLTLPQTAVLSVEQNPFVLVVDDSDAVARKDIQVGVRGNQKLEITQGVTPEDRVISEGQVFLEEGQEVRVVRETGDENGDSEPGKEGGSEE